MIANENDVLEHYGVKGMEWRQTKKPPPLINPARRAWTEDVRPTQIRRNWSSDVRPRQSIPLQWSANFKNRKIRRERAKQGSAWLESNSIFMQRKAVSITDKSLNAEQRQALREFLNRQGTVLLGG